MNELVGRRVSSVFLGEGGGDNYITFETDGGAVTYEAEGDCDSESWFADIIGVQSLLGEVVVSVHDAGLPGYDVDDGRGRQDDDKVYGHDIKTRMGVCTVVYRNSSNGYYGGSLGLIESPPESVTFRAIVQDYPV